LSIVQLVTNGHVAKAVQQNRALSRDGLLELLFAWAFKGLVYPQIWEDPAVDMEALAITPDCHIVAIASGGCNILSYLIADPARITAVDLNRAHVALNRLKLTAARHLPSCSAYQESDSGSPGIAHCGSRTGWCRWQALPVRRCSASGLRACFPPSRRKARRC